MKPDKETISGQVRAIVAAAAQRDPNSIEGGWRLGLPAPIGMDSIRIGGMLPDLNTLIQQYQPTHFISLTELSQQTLVADLITLVWGKVQPDK